MIRKKIIKNLKTNKLEPEPDFYPAPTFYRIITFKPYAEGEIWEGEIVEEINTGKKDRKGREILVKKIKLIKRIEYPAKSMAEFDKNKNCFVVPVFSGDVKVREIDLPVEGYVYQIDPFSREVNCFAHANGLSQRVHSVNEEKLLITKPAWLPQEEYEKAIKTFSDIRKRAEKIKEENLKREAERAALINSGKKLPELSVDELIEQFILYGITIIDPQPIDHSMPFYGQESAVFDIGGFKFRFNFKLLDEDYYEIESILSSNGVIKDKEIMILLERFARFASRPDKKRLPLDFYLDKEEEIIFRKEIILSGEAGRYSDPGEGRLYLHATDIEGIKQSLQEEVDKIEINEAPITKEFQDLIRMVYSPQLVKKIEIVTDTEEGVGAKDDSYYATTKVVATVDKIYKKKIFIDERVSPQIREILLRE